jgi:hypothetical protein
MYTTGLTPDERRITCVTITPDIEAAIRASITRHADPHVAFIPEGPYVVPVYRPLEGDIAA